MNDLEDLLREALFEAADKRKEALAKVRGELREVTFTERVCSKCGVSKQYDQFNFCSRSKADYRNGVQRKKAQCRACDGVEALEYRSKNLEKLRQRDRAFHYKRKFGVPNTLALKLADPNERIAPCPICHEVERLVMDHDHNTKQIRELICSSCNSLLGYARENIDTLYSAIAYLKKHRGV